MIHRSIKDIGNCLEATMGMIGETRARTHVEVVPQHEGVIVHEARYRHETPDVRPITLFHFDGVSYFNSVTHNPLFYLGTLSESKSATLVAIVPFISVRVAYLRHPVAPEGVQLPDALPS